jgi:hypothetical protein
MFQPKAKSHGLSYGTLQAYVNKSVEENNNILELSGGVLHFVRPGNFFPPMRIKLCNTQANPSTDRKFFFSLEHICRLVMWSHQILLKRKTTFNKESNKPFTTVIRR